MRWPALAFCLISLPAFSQVQTESRELAGQLGGRAALINLYATELPDGGARVTGEYVILPTLQRRYLEGERSRQLGVTFLREGTSAILYGRPETATLQGTWSGGTFKGARYGPGGQLREQFEFNENFPPMDAYSASVRCETTEGRYSAALAYGIEGGKLKSIEWRSKVSPGEHSCNVTGLEQRPFNGGLRFASGRCSVTLRELGEGVRVAAEDCAQMCGSQGYLEPVLVDRRGNCQLLRPQAR
jgi:hypothetical protein